MWFTVSFLVLLSVFRGGPRSYTEPPVQRHERVLAPYVATWSDACQTRQLLLVGHETDQFQQGLRTALAVIVGTFPDGAREVSALIGTPMCAGRMGEGRRRTWDDVLDREDDREERPVGQTP